MSAIELAKRRRTLKKIVGIIQKSSTPLLSLLPDYSRHRHHGPDILPWAASSIELSAGCKRSQDYADDNRFTGEPLSVTQSIELCV